jgi:hypothetical protein
MIAGNTEIEALKARHGFRASTDWKSYYEGEFLDLDEYGVYTDYFAS